MASHCNSYYNLKDRTTSYTRPFLLHRGELVRSFSYWNARGPTLHSGEDAETGRLIPAGTFWYVWLMFSGGEKCICGCLFVGMNENDFCAKHFDVAATTGTTVLLSYRGCCRYEHRPPPYRPEKEIKEFSWDPPDGLMLCEQCQVSITIHVVLFHMIIHAHLYKYMFV